jgi:hypothetical protein
MYRLENDIKKVLQKINCDSVNRIKLAHNNFPYGILWTMQWTLGVY